MGLLIVSMFCPLLHEATAYPPLGALTYAPLGGRGGGGGALGARGSGGEGLGGTGGWGLGGGKGGGEGASATAPVKPELATVANTW